MFEKSVSRYIILFIILFTVTPAISFGSNLLPIKAYKKFIISMRVITSTI